MNERIKNYYKYLMINDKQFKKFVELQKTLTDNEMIEKYSLSIKKEQDN